MKTADITRRTAAAAVIALLAACGGGGGSDDGASGGGNGGGGSGGGTNPGTPALVTGQYRTEPAAQSMAAALTAMNAQGEQGYAFLSALGTNVSGLSMEMGDFYLHDSAHAGSKLQYETLPEAVTAATALAQFNQQGARGFAFKSGIAFGSTTDIRTLYVKDTSRSSTFAYEQFPTSSATNRDAFQTQLNAQGARGFRLVGPWGAGNDMFNLYAKDSSTTTYSYKLFDVAAPYGMANGDALRSRLDEMGAQGYLFLSAFVLPGNAGVQVFEKSSAQSGAIAYRLQASNPQASVAQLLTQFNAQAAQGYFFFSELFTDDGARHTLSVQGAAHLRHPMAGVTFP